MENVYRASKAILLYLVIVLILQTFFGEKTARNMSLMILFSMLLLNSETVASYLTAVTDNLTLEVKNDTSKSNSSSNSSGSNVKPSNYATGIVPSVNSGSGNIVNDYTGGGFSSNYLTVL